MVINIETDYKDRLDCLWNNQTPEIVNRGYALEKELWTGSLLELGLNPSSGEGNGSFFYTAQADKYFTKPIELAAEHCQKLSHHDLFFIRETSQDTVLSLKENNPDFFEEQLKITKEIITRVQPKMIVIINAKACRLFKKMYNFEPVKYWNESLGVDILPQLGNIPVLFSGMLSGQRALDVGSFVRLKWHVRHICRELNIHFDNA